MDDCSSKRWGLTRMKASHGEAQELSTPFKGPARTELIAFTNNAAEQSFLCLPEDPPVCWICLDCGTPTQPLARVCKCPRQAHLNCVARWQLQSAGTRKETHCEFCDGELPDWKKTLTPQCGANAPAVMNVNFDGRTYSFEVRPGPDGYKQFTEAIRKAFSLPDDSELNITFTCDEPVAQAPDTPPSTPFSLPTTPVPVPAMMEEEPLTPPASPPGSLLTLQGAGAYDAAVHCASVSAARRITQHSPGGTRLPDSPAAAPSTSQQGRRSGQHNPWQAGASSSGAGPSEEPATRRHNGPGHFIQKFIRGSKGTFGSRKK